MLDHIQLIDLCARSYTGDFSSLNLLKDNCYVGDALHKYVVEYDDCFAIIVRGSQNKYDWFNNLTNFGSSDDFNHTNVHQGFLSQMDAELNPRVNFDKPVYLTGHSLGGAISILFADKLAQLGPKVQEVVTFGSPMVGALSFKEQIESKLKGKITRYINGDDVTPYLPPVKYYPVGKDIQIGIRHSWLNPLKYIRIFQDHALPKYTTNLKDYLCKK